MEDEVFDKAGMILQIAQGVPTGCCGFPDFQVAVGQFNNDCAQSINQKIEQYGYKVDGYNWIEHRYISHGQNGGHVQPIPHFCVRVRKLDEEDVVE